MSPADAERGLRALQVDPRELQRVPTFEEAVKKLAEMQARAKKQYKKLALELHPDRNGGDPEKTALLAVVNRVYQDVQNLKVERRQPRPVQHIVFNIPVTQQRVTAKQVRTYDARKAAFIRF